MPCNVLSGRVCSGEHREPGAARLPGDIRLREESVEEGKTEACVDADDDGALLARIGQGSHQAFHALMLRHMTFALRLAQRVAGNRDDADEIAQEAFLKVWSLGPRWRQDGAAQFRSWLYRVVVNLCLDRRRRTATLPLEDAGDPSDPTPDSLEQVAAGETARIVAQAIEDLPPRQRAAITLCYYTGVNGAEAARALEVSLPALESLLVRGRRALRLRLTGMGVLDRNGEPS